MLSQKQEDKDIVEVLTPITIFVALADVSDYFLEMENCFFDTSKPTINRSSKAQGKCLLRK